MYADGGRHRVCASNFVTVKRTHLLVLYCIYCIGCGYILYSMPSVIWKLLLPNVDVDIDIAIAIDIAIEEETLLDDVMCAKYLSTDRFCPLHAGFRLQFSETFSCAE